MPFKIGLYGSASIPSQATLNKAEQTGSALGKQNCTVITGACSGLPYRGAREAAASGGMVIGYSPVRSMEEQRSFTPQDDLSIYAHIYFTPTLPIFDDLDVAKKYRNVISTAQCDGGIILAGGWGTLHEFCSLVDFGKVIGVVTGTDGIADLLEEITETVPAGTEIIFDADPATLVKKVLDHLENHQTSSPDSLSPSHQH